MRYTNKKQTPNDIETEIICKFCVCYFFPNFRYIFSRFCCSCLVFGLVFGMVLVGDGDMEVAVTVFCMMLRATDTWLELLYEYSFMSTKIFISSVSISLPLTIWWCVSLSLFIVSGECWTFDVITFFWCDDEIFKR